jgi:hypothetical protein
MTHPYSPRPRSRSRRRRPRSWRIAAVAAALSCVATALTLAGPAAAQTTNPPYSCTATGGPNGDAAAIGWLASNQGATACLGGSFYVYNGINQSYGFGVYNDSATTWRNADGYLPALVTSFTDDGAKVSITNFGDKVLIGGNPFVLIYSRVSVTNPGTHSLTIDPEPSSGLVPLSTVSDTVRPGGTVNHDYVVASDEFGGTYAWPTTQQMVQAGSYDAHFQHMQRFWTAQVAQIADAYYAGFIYTQIDRSGDALDTGTNGYHQEYEHDVIGILANFFNEGYFTDAHALLNEVDTVVGTSTQYSDGTWTYPWLWALYYLKTGDKSFLEAHLTAPGAAGAAEQPSIEATVQAIAANRTGPGGIMEETNDIDADGYWTSDNYEALLGLASYEYLAKVVGDISQEQWAASEYQSLLSDVDSTLSATISTHNLDYLPCSMVEPNTDNRCSNPEDANWAAPGVYNNWAWNGYLMDAPIGSPGNESMADWLDNTLSYGFGRIQKALPAGTVGGYPGEGLYSTAYNAAYGGWGLASNEYRDQGVLSYEFLISNDQAGPYAWWEGSAAPSTTTPWTGLHPASGGGSSPHSWGIALANLTLLDSIVAQRANGTLVVGRGIPNSWVADGKPFGITNYPVSGGARIGVHVSEKGRAVTLRLTGSEPEPTAFELPAFVDNIAHVSAGTIDESGGVVTVPAGTRTVTVNMSAEPSTSQPPLPSTAPKVTGVSPASAAAGQTVTLTGANFGATAGASYLLFSDDVTNWGQPGDAAAFQIDSWSNTSITFTVPTPSGPNGQWAVTPGTTATVSVNTVNGVSNQGTVSIVSGS